MRRINPINKLPGTTYYVNDKVMGVCVVYNWATNSTPCSRRVQSRLFLTCHFCLLFKNSFPQAFLIGSRPKTTSVGFSLIPPLSAQSIRSTWTEPVLRPAAARLILVYVQWFFHFDSECKTWRVGTRLVLLPVSHSVKWTLDPTAWLLLQFGYVHKGSYRIRTPKAMEGMMMFPWELDS